MDKNDSDEQLRVHFIPDNFIENGRVFNGMFKTRNFVEACVLAAPVAIFSFLLTTKFPLNIRIFTVSLFTLLVFGVGVLGWQGESLIEFLQHVIMFSRKKRTAIYNPRVKHESRPEYLIEFKAKTPVDVLIEKARAKLLGTEDETYEEKDIYDDDSVTTIFEDDLSVDGTYIPDSLKSKKQLREDAKKKKEREKQLKKAMKEEEKNRIEIEQEANELIRQQRKLERKNKSKKGRGNK